MLSEKYFIRVLPEKDGHIFSGTYAISGNIILVYTNFGHKSTQVDDMNPETLARLLLFEITDTKTPNNESD